MPYRPRPATPRIRPRRGALALCAMVALPIAPLAAWGWSDVRNELRLRAGGAVTLATITETRTSGVAAREVMVRYRFHAPPGSASGYTCSDATGRRDLWASVDAAAYPGAHGRLPVRYLPADPYVNRPDAPAAAVSPLGDAVAGAAVFSALLGALALALVLDLAAARAAVRRGRAREGWAFASELPPV